MLAELKDLTRRTLSIEILFERILANDAITELATITSLLPNDLKELRALQTRCMRGARIAARDGRHQEVRRLGDLSRQIGRLADRKAPDQSR